MRRASLCKSRHVCAIFIALVNYRALIGVVGKITKYAVQIRKVAFRLVNAPRNGGCVINPGKIDQGCFSEEDCCLRSFGIVIHALRRSRANFFASSHV